MKMKPSERVPYRRGDAEERALTRLRELRSRHVPAWSSDNLWLRFAVRLLGELCEVAGGVDLSFQLGDPAGTSSALRLLGSPPMELSASTGEVRLRPVEAGLLDDLRSRLGHGSRSATLRYALFACQQLCESMAQGGRLWAERQGTRHLLPSLLDIAANMERGGDRSRVVVGSAPDSSLAAHAANAQPVRRAGDGAREAALLCEVSALHDDERTRLCGDAPIAYVSEDVVLERLHAPSLCIQAEISESTLRTLSSISGSRQIRVLLRNGSAPVVEAVPSQREPSKVVQLDHRLPRPVGKTDGLDAIRALAAGRSGQRRSARGHNPRSFDW
jgi:hypothetical protein